MLQPLRMLSSGFLKTVPTCPRLPLTCLDSGPGLENLQNKNTRARIEPGSNLDSGFVLQARGHPFRGRRMHGGAELGRGPKVGQPRVLSKKDEVATGNLQFAHVLVREWSSMIIAHLLVPDTKPNVPRWCVSRDPSMPRDHVISLKEQRKHAHKHFASARCLFFLLLLHWKGANHAVFVSVCFELGVGGFGV